MLMPKSRIKNLYLLSMLMPKSRIKNLYLAGESAFAPGLLGCYLGAQKVMNLL